MDTATRDLITRAAGGDVKAFVALTHQFRHFAFGAALAVVGDFQIAEDVVQEAFLAAWSSLPSLEAPPAFPAWLRSIVRRQAFRVIRRKQLAVAPLDEAEHIASDEPLAERRVDGREQAVVALAALGALPDQLREPAILYFVHECSHQDIAVFLGLTATTVNNRLHAARSQLKERMLAMVEETFHAQALPDEFAHRIGRLIEARGPLVEALFDPAALPDILGELALSDEAGKRAVPAHVVQRMGGGVVRAIAATDVDSLPRGATVLNASRYADAPLSREQFAKILPALLGSAKATGASTLIETGIKVIDVMCPLVAGGSALLVGEPGTGLMVLMEELVRRLSGGEAKLKLVVVMPPRETWPAREDGNDISYADALKRDGYSEGTRGAVETFFLRGDDQPWTADRLPPGAADTVIHLTRALAQANIWPAVDSLTSQSRLLESKRVSGAHQAVAARVREALAALGTARGDAMELSRARKLQNFFAQLFFATEAHSKRPGVSVSLADALAGCREILDGKLDDLPEEVFAFTGKLADIRK